MLRQGPVRFDQLIANLTVPTRCEPVPDLVLQLSPEPLSVWLGVEAALNARQPPPFWAHAWPGGLALAKWVLESPSWVRGKRVLDFASGCGVSGLAAAQRGAQVVCSEVDPLAVRAIELNAERNGLEVTVRGEDLIGSTGWDVVLVGDVFYERSLSERLQRWLGALSAVVLVGDPGRQFMPQERVELLATYDFPPNPAWDSVVDRPARVWRWGAR